MSFVRFNSAITSFTNSFRRHLIITSDKLQSVPYVFFTIDELIFVMMNILVCQTPYFFPSQFRNRLQRNNTHRSLLRILATSRELPRRSEYLYWKDDSQTPKQRFAPNTSLWKQTHDSKRVKLAVVALAKVLDNEEERRRLDT